MKKGHITVYLTLVFTLILSLFLSAFEAARGSYLKLRTENAVQTAIHSVFGEYHVELFERYGLLFIDTSYMTSVPDYRNLEERMELYLGYNLIPQEEQTLLFARDWYGIEDYNVGLTNIRLATDDWGGVLRKQAVNYMENYVGKEFIEEMQSWVMEIEKYEISSEKFEEFHEGVIEEKKECWQENHLLDEDWQTIGLPSLNFKTDYVDSLFAGMGNYGDAGISTKAFNPLEHVSYRWKIQGTEALEETGVNLTEEILFGEYILLKMGNYRNVREGSKLDYQAEYILFGGAQDTYNLYKMCESLFLFRGTANLIMLLSDTETQKVIETISQLGLLIEVPPELIQAAINICWAAAESFQDVNCLLKGEKVELLKEPKEFKVGLGSLTSVGDTVNVSSNSAGSDLSIKLGYEDYLRLFLYMQLPVIKVYRCMDMMEADIRLTEGNEDFRIDGCADAVSMEIGIHSEYGYFYSMERKYSYY